MNRRLWVPIVLAISAAGYAAEPARPMTGEAYLASVRKRISDVVDAATLIPERARNPDWAAGLALLKFARGQDAEANKLVHTYCGRDPMTTYVGKPTPKRRCEALLRIGLDDGIRRRLEPGALQAVEDFAFELVTKHHAGMTSDRAAERFFERFDSSENHYLNDRRRYHLSLEILSRAERYGPEHEINGRKVGEQCRAWEQFWIGYFRDRADEGTDIELAHPSSYGECTMGVYYDVADLVKNPEVRRMAGNFLTLFWAEVASEFEPRTGQRAGLGETRNPLYDGQRSYWAQALLYCYGWHDLTPSPEAGFGILTFVGGYRPPPVLAAIARDPDRGAYPSTSRRAGLLTAGTYAQGYPIVFDETGGSRLRRDVYYTPDYALATITYDPARVYRNSITLAQTMGATFAADAHLRINVIGTGYYPNRATCGITGKAVSIIARDPNAAEGRGRFMSNGTRVFLNNTLLWENRVEDPSGWFFTRAAGAYAAIRAAGAGYKVTTKTYVWPDRQLKEVERKNGHYLELKDMWAPVVIQMGRAKDYESFEAFQASVKDNPFRHEDGKLTYTSEAGDTYEAWAKFTALPKINGQTINLNPAKTYDSPFLSMDHGGSKAVISYPGHKDLVLEW